MIIYGWSLSRSQISNTGGAGAEINNFGSATLDFSKLFLFVFLAESPALSQGRAQVKVREARAHPVREG